MKPSFGLIHWLRRPSVWICIIALVLTAAPISDMGRVAYTPSVVTHPLMTFFIVAPAITAASAWEISRFRPLVSSGRPIVVKVYFYRVFPFSFVLVIGYLIALLSEAPSFTVLASGLLWFTLGYTLVVGICWTIIGTVFGLSMKPLIAICIATLLGYGWYAVPPSMSPGVLQRLTGDFLACCSLDNVLDYRTILASVVFLVGVTMVIVSIVALLRRKKIRTTFLGLVGVACMAGAFVLAAQLSEFGLKPRDRADMHCREGVCARPEVPEDIVNNNISARNALKEIAPLSWRKFVDRPVLWSGGSVEHLSFSGQTTVEAVVGDYVDQAGSAELIATDAKICNVRAKDIGIVRTMQPWDPHQPVTLQDFIHRVEREYCALGGRR
ncbi:hypothetical protein ACGE24_05240 [Corynebacterium kroppenstedtii]|uniref:hypothetical protein n=1 Tax=Corynebacterium sp. PCR 32 TaxID=3351342 RepID=UPI00309BF133